MTRMKDIVKNMMFGTLAKIVGMLLNFVSRTLFIYTLGSEYLGVNGLYTEILGVLSFAELGFGSAMTFAMYKPVADGDNERVIQLLAFYKKVYSIIGAIITLLGICVVPFLQYIVRGADALSIQELRIYFMFFLANTVIGYFVSYKYSYLNAQMRNYVATNVDTIFNFCTVVVQIAAIWIFKSYYAYLIAHTAILCVSRGFISVYLNKKEPVLKCIPDRPLPRDEKKQIINEVKGLAVHQFASVAVHSTDNIIISSMSSLGIVGVGLVSNYNMLMTTVLSFVLIVFNSVTSGFGNIVAKDEKQHFHDVFYELNILNAWMYGFCCIAFFILIPPFITLWIGKENLIDNVSFLLITVNCYFQGQCTLYNNARNACGNFNKDKWLALLQAIVNLIVSVVCVRKLGLVGVYIGTVASRLVYVCLRPACTYRMLFDRSACEYYLVMLRYFLIVCVAGIAAYMATYRLLMDVSVMSFIFAAMIVVVVANAVMILFCWRKPEAKRMIGRLLSVRRK